MKSKASESSMSWDCRDKLPEKMKPREAWRFLLQLTNNPWSFTTSEKLLKTEEVKTLLTNLSAVLSPETLC